VSGPLESNDRAVAGTISEINKAPEEAALAVFVFREVVSILFVIAWLVLFAIEMFTMKYELPIWFHCVGVGVMAYALGINVSQLTAFRKPPSRIRVTDHGVEASVG
jgi:hypothetical protein